VSGNERVSGIEICGKIMVGLYQEKDFHGVNKVEAGPVISKWRRIYDGHGNIVPLVFGEAAEHLKNMDTMKEAHDTVDDCNQGDYK